MACVWLTAILERTRATRHCTLGRPGRFGRTSAAVPAVPLHPLSRKDGVSAATEEVLGAAHDKEVLLFCLQRLAVDGAFD